MAGGPSILLRDVRFKWPGGRAFSLHIPEFSGNAGDTVLLLGESGSGKSTLLSLLCGTVRASHGAVVVAGQDLRQMTGRARDRLRAEQIGIVFQQFNLLPFATVEDNILLPLRFAPSRRARCHAPKQEAARLCSALGLPDGVVSAKAHRLSVGQQQRVAVARGLIGAPPILIADEPTSALDETSQSQFLDLLFAQVRAQGSTLVMVSHDPRLAGRFDRVVKMSELVQLEQDAA